MVGWTRHVSKVRRGYPPTVGSFRGRRQARAVAVQLVALALRGASS